MEFIKVGKICTTHGLNGEVKVRSDFKYKNRLYISGMKFYFGDKKDIFELLSYRKQNKFDLLTFNTLNNIDKVIKYCGTYLYVNRLDLNLDNNCYLNEDIIGFDAIFENKIIGKILNITDAGHGNEIIKIGSFYIPKNDNFIKDIDLINKKMYFKNIEGLIL